ncbi:MAG TPA: ZPR1 zinc finger domain-containing protein [Candidatus Thermoplasmatota archaeon]|nr:ZPR1 zinc finger domain-containing protein [Candidatus Thermoplasmatota archaeon]
MVRSRIDEAICPACGGRGLDYAGEEIDLPFLGKSLETLLQCEACGYRHTDFVLTDVHEPTRVKYTVATGDDMMARVVRSSSGTIRIPELGVTIEPGVASEAFISNVEGVLVRIERVLDQLGRDAEEPEMRERIMELQDRLGLMRDGKAPPVTLMLEDPFGNSRILAEGAIVEPIPPEEAGELKVGMLVFDPEGKLAKED